MGGYGTLFEKFFETLIIFGVKHQKPINFSKILRQKT